MNLDKEKLQRVLRAMIDQVDGNIKRAVNIEPLFAEPTLENEMNLDKEDLRRVLRAMIDQVDGNIKWAVNIEPLFAEPTLDEAFVRRAVRDLCQQGYLEPLAGDRHYALNARAIDFLESEHSFAPSMREIEQRPQREPGARVSSRLSLSSSRASIPAGEAGRSTTDPLQ